MACIPPSALPRSLAICGAMASIITNSDGANATMYAFNIGRCVVPATSNNPAATRTIRIAQRVKMGKRLLLLITCLLLPLRRFVNEISIKYRPRAVRIRGAGGSRSERDVMVRPCRDADVPLIEVIINEPARAYEAATRAWHTQTESSTSAGATLCDSALCTWKLPIRKGSLR